MDTLLQQRKRAHSSPKYSFDEVFSRGHIIYAHITADGSRIVTFENPTDYFKNHTVGSNVRASQAAIGSGHSIEEAFRNAMKHFFTGGSYRHKPSRQFFMRKRSGTVTLKRSTLDRWMADHKGTFRALKDGEEVICSLDGIHPHNPLHHINLRGTGRTVSEALQSAFAGTI